jgi:hypothetical protein
VPLPKYDHFGGGKGIFMNDAQLLTDVPKGEWAALTHNRDRLLAHSTELNEALQRAYSTGEKDPFVLRVSSRALYSR